MEVIIIVLLVGFIIYRLKSKKRPRVSRRGSSSTSAHVDAHRKYMAKNIPVLLSKFSVFQPSYLARLSAYCINNGTVPSFSNDELLAGVSRGQASWTLNHCMRLASARYNNSRSISDAKKAKADYISMKVSRACEGCKKVPQSQMYAPDDRIPLYPCANCKEDNICDIWYKAEFK
jgi:hypothetical protein